MQTLNEIGTELVATTIVCIKTVDYNGYGPANSSGALANSVQWMPNKYGLLDIVATGKPASYVGTLVYGRSAGRGVPPGVILEWMDYKGLWLNEKDSKRKSIAFLIGRKIRDAGNIVTRKQLAPTVIFDEVATVGTKLIADNITNEFLSIVR